ncbi:hypothetical protein [Morganella psychrotolerans]|uniref:Uncharacterized protein n=1 Tax=Morganella psychrotolerans TaxID=368603 RepID=A0A1B8HSS2_9GAMM|nr:hypothetical protein [Morganella psychrotolerans]OBU12480.1 hypothetical protein AYY18_15180 [Morganella psychrotolerans]
MKNNFILVFLFLFISGCDNAHVSSSHNSSGQPETGGVHQFDGVYICKISTRFNQTAIEQKNKHAFPSVMIKTTITVKAGVMTIHGLTSGDYVSHQMSVSEPYVTESGRVLKSEVELFYKNGNIQEDFTKKYGIASVSEGDPFNKGFMQQLSSFRLSSDPIFAGK